MAGISNIRSTFKYTRDGSTFVHKVHSAFTIIIMQFVVSCRTPKFLRMNAVLRNFGLISGSGGWFLLEEEVPYFTNGFNSKSVPVMVILVEGNHPL